MISSVQDGGVTVSNWNKGSIINFATARDGRNKTTCILQGEGKGIEVVTLSIDTPERCRVDVIRGSFAVCFEFGVATIFGYYSGAPRGAVNLRMTLFLDLGCWRALEYPCVSMVYQAYRRE